MALSTSAQSSTERHMGPVLSMLQLSAIAPKRLTRPKVGRSPVTPQIADGARIEPSVSVPMEKPTNPPAVADPGPADEPCDPIDVSHGFIVCPANQMSSSANSPVASLPMSTAPASRSLVTTVASTSMMRSLNGAAPQVVGYPFTANRSLIP